MSRGALVLAAVGALIWPSQVASGETSFTASELDAARERAAYGLDANPATVRSIVASGRDVGRQEWGLVLTQEEEATLDLPGRAVFANELAATVVPYMNSVATSGGVYIDQAADGGAVVLLTKRDPAIEDHLAKLAEGASRPVTVAFVSHTEGELVAAVERAWVEWPSDGARIRSISVDLVGNQIVVEVAREAVNSATRSAAGVAAVLGVPVAVQGADAVFDAACTDRDHCDTPLRAGIRVINQDNFELCTMAFHITKGTDEQWLTAGHCGYSNIGDWYSQSFGLIGHGLATLLVANGIDAMRIQMPDAQASNWVYGKSLRVTSTRQPILNEGICASLGNSDIWDCGTVSSTQTSWTSTTCGCVVWGADSSGILIFGGDSGSPIVNNVTSGSYVALGIVDNTGGNFAKVSNVLSSFSASLYVP